MVSDKIFLQKAIKQAKKSFDKWGFPAGAVLVKNNKIISRWISIWFALNDPTEHSETSCIKKACRKLKTIDLSWCILYSSMEPCLMCFSVANRTNVSKIVFACKKTSEMVKIWCYEGYNEIENINKLNNNKVSIEFINDFENESLELLDERRKKQKI